MKKLIIIISLLLIPVAAFAQDVQGDTLAIDGKKVLKIWGTHYERGYAHGYLMGTEIKQIFDAYIIGYIFQNNPDILFEHLPKRRSEFDQRVFSFLLVVGMEPPEQSTKSLQ